MKRSLAIVSTPEMVDSVNGLILNDRKVRKEVISVKMGISLATVHKIVHDDLTFF